MICRMNIKMFHLQNFVAYTNQGSLLKLFLASLKIHFWLLKFKLLNVVLTVVIHFILLSADGSKNICWYNKFFKNYISVDAQSF